MEVNVVVVPYLLLYWHWGVRLTGKRGRGFVCGFRISMFVDPLKNELLASRHDRQWGWRQWNGARCVAALGRLRAETKGGYCNLLS